MYRPFFGCFLFLRAVLSKLSMLNATSSGSPTPPLRPSASISPQEVLAPSSSQWQALGGEAVEAVLRSGAVALLDADWVVKQADAGGILKRRQDLPSEAFITLDELKEIGAIPATPNWSASLPIIVVSCEGAQGVEHRSPPVWAFPVNARALPFVPDPWLEPDHPDSKGQWLRLVGIALRMWMDPGATGASSKARRNGIMWDFPSLHQHPPGGERSELEDNLFKQALGSLANFYSHPAIAVFKLTCFPEGYPQGYTLVTAGANVKDYPDRGWTFTESCWASMSKPRDLTLDLGLLNVDALASFSFPRVGLVKQCTQGGGRLPPPLPADFARLIEDKSFTNGKDDRPLVVRLYAEAFERNMGQASTLDYSDLKWGDDESRQVRSLLPSASGLKSLSMTGNAIHYDEATQLANAVLAVPTLESFGGIPIAGLRADRLIVLRIKSTSLGMAEALVLSALLEDAPSVTECNVRGKGLDSASASLLSKVAVAKGILLFGIKHDQAEAKYPNRKLTPVDLILIGSDLRVGASLTSIDLRGNKLGVEGWTTIFNTLCDSPASKISTWDLSNEGLGIEIAKPLANYISATASFSPASLTSMNLEGNRLGPDGAKALAPSLRDNASITECNLRGNGLGAEGWIAIFTALRDSKVSRITKWDLSSQIGISDSIKPLAEYISVSASLTSINLMGNYVGPEGAKALAPALRDSPSMTFVDVSGNAIGDEGMRTIGDALLSSSTSKLGAIKCDAFDLPVGTTSLDLSGKRISSAAGTLLAGVVKGNASLTQVCPAGNTWSSVVVITCSHP